MFGLFGFDRGKTRKNKERKISLIRLAFSGFVHYYGNRLAYNNNNNNNNNATIFYLPTLHLGVIKKSLKRVRETKNVKKKRNN